MNALKALLTQNMQSTLNRTVLHQAVYSIGLLMYAFLLSFHMTGTNIITGLLVINWLFEGNLKEKVLRLKGNNIAILTIAVFFIYAAGLLTSANIETGFKHLDSKLPLALLTLVIATSKTNLKLFKWILISFSVGLLIHTLWAGFFFYQNYYIANDPYLIFAQGLFRDNYTTFSGIHPTYLTLYILFAVCGLIFLVYRHGYELSMFSITVCILVIVYFVLLSLLLSARMPLFSFSLVGISIGIHYLIKRRKYFILSIGIASFVALSIFVVKSPLLNLRFKEIKETTLAPPKGIHHNSTNIRVGIFECAFSMLKDNWIIGVGTGDVQTLLNSCYKERDFSDILYKENYALHNTYLDIWLSSGIPGILLLGLLFYKILKQAINQGNTLYLIFIFVFSLCCLTDSMLTMNKGIAFFSFFNALFVSRPSFTPVKRILLSNNDV